MGKDKGRKEESPANFRDFKDISGYLRDHPEIRFIRMVYADIVGRMMDLTIPVKEAESFFSEGKGFDGSSVAGFREDVKESDLIFRPEIGAFRPPAWGYESRLKEGLKWEEAVVFGHIYTPKGDHFEGDTRYFLERLIDKEKRLFTDMMVGAELEFFLIKKRETEDERPEPTDKGGYHTGGRFGEVRKEVLLMLENLGWDYECDHHEVAPGQHEIDLKYTKAKDMADCILFARYLTKKVAKAYGVEATFAPKVFTNENGSGMHTHQSLWKNGENLFFNPEDKYNLSVLAKQYVAGLLKYGPEFTVIWNQLPNSFKRLVPGFEAPTYLAWGRENRSAFIRVPQYSRGKSHAARIELRSPDPALNPYLGFACMLAAGLAGIKKRLKFPDPVEENIFEMDAGLRRERGIKDLPADMGEAIRLFESSRLAKKTLRGPKEKEGHIYREVLRNAEHEWGKYNREVTSYDHGYLSRF